MGLLFHFDLTLCLSTILIDIAAGWHSRTYTYLSIYLSIGFTIYKVAEQNTIDTQSLYTTIWKYCVSLSGAHTQWNKPNSEWKKKSPIQYGTKYTESTHKVHTCAIECECECMQNRTFTYIYNPSIHPSISVLCMRVPFFLFFFICHFVSRMISKWTAVGKFTVSAKIWTISKANMIAIHHTIYTQKKEIKINACFSVIVFFFIGFFIT